VNRTARAIAPALRWIVFALLAALGWTLPGPVHASASTTALSRYTYDTPAVALSHVHASGATETSSAPLSALREWSALPSVAARGAATTRISRSVATEAADDFVDLTTPGARSHILDGEIRPNGTYSGGHRPGTGFSGKSEFPSGWSDGRILHEISDVATDPAATRIVQGSRTVVTGSRGGVDIRVVIDNTTGEIVTGYPTNMPINP